MKAVTAQHREGVPDVEHGLERERRAAQEQLPQRHDEVGAVAAARRRRVRAAHRLRERRQPAARARHGPAAGARGARVARRLALGRSRGQLIVESLVLAMAGGALGVALAYALVLRGIMLHHARGHAAVRGGRAPEPAGARCSPSRRALLSGVLFGCVPAWQAARQNTSETLKEGGRVARRRTPPAAAGARRHGVRARADAARRAAAWPSTASLKMCERQPRVPDGAPADLLAAGARTESSTAVGAGHHVLRAAHRARAGGARRGLGVGLDRHAGQRHRLRHAVHDRRQARRRIPASGPAPASTW